MLQLIQATSKQQRLRAFCHDHHKLDPGNDHRTRLGKRDGPLPSYVENWVWAATLNAAIGWTPSPTKGYGSKAVIPPALKPSFPEAGALNQGHVDGLCMTYGERLQWPLYGWIRFTLDNYNIYIYIRAIAGETLWISGCMMYNMDCRILVVGAPLGMVNWSWPIPSARKWALTINWGINC